MNKESLNEFYEADRFHKALRDRIDAHEPELSDSLWDRIEHDLNKQEGKNRRALAWVYILSALLLVSSGALYYLWNENQKLAENTSLAPVAESLNPELKDAETAPKQTTIESASSATQSGLALTEKTNAATRRSASASRGGNGTQANQPYSYSSENGVPAGSENTKSAEGEVPPAQSSDVRSTEAEVRNPANMEAGTLVAPIVSAEGDESVAAEKQEVEKIKSSENPKPKAELRPQFFIGLQGGLNRISQNPLSGNTAWLNIIEMPLNFTEYGMHFGVRLSNGITLSSGILSYSTGHVYSFDIVPTAPTPIPTPFPGSDSIIAGDKYTLVNRQNWIEVPVMVGYQYGLGKWSLQGEAGVSANFINSYSGSVPTPSYNRFEPDGTQNVNPYKNFVNVRAGLGFGYEIVKGFQISAMVNWRQALGYSTNAPANVAWQSSYAHRKPQSLGAQLRLTYYLK